MKIDRLLGILMMLINKKKVTARQLSDYFEVSVRTIQRDMDTLSLAGIPFYADVGVHGGYQLLDNFKLEKGFLNRNEASILFTFLKGLEGVTPYAEVESIYNKFSSLDVHDLEDKKLIVKMGSDSTSNLKDHIALLSRAREALFKVKISYYDVNFKITERVISPHALLLLSSIWYSYAYCGLRAEFRMFKVSRIASCEVLEDTFELKEWPEQLPWETGSDDNRPYEDIVLEIDRYKHGILPDYFEPANCRVLEDKIIVHLKLPIGEWLYSQLMVLIPHVKIVKPESLKKGFMDRLIRSIDRNSP